MIKVEINYQTKVPGSYEALFKRLARETFRLLKISAKGGCASPRLELGTRAGAKGDFVLSVVFIGPAKMKFLNKKYRAKNKVTDVLSFGEVNEIIICYAQAVKQAKSVGHSIKQEVAWLFVHGLLHLLGFTHETEKKYQRLVKLQQKIFQS